MTGYTHCVRDLPHKWNPVSGWCDRGCGWRDDGHNERKAIAAASTDYTEPHHQNTHALSTSNGTK